MSVRVDCAVDCKSVLGESPIWCGRSKRLYWVDINGRTVSTYEPAVQQMPCLPVPMPALVGTIVPRAGGNLLACLEEDVVPVNPDTRVVGLPLAAVPLEHRARPARSSSRERGARDPRFQLAAAQRSGRCNQCCETHASRPRPRRPGNALQRRQVRPARAAVGRNDALVVRASCDTRLLSHLAPLHACC